MEKIKENSLERTIYQNEIDANRQMTSVSVFMAILMSLIFLMFLFKAFPNNNYTSIYITMPVDIIILLTPLYWKKTEFIKKRGYKYFILFSTLFVMSTLNVVLPKHGIIGWALVIVLTCHYYNPKFCRQMYIFTILSMLLSLYLGMFLGEYDNNLLTSGLIQFNEETGQYYLYQPDLAKDRFEMLKYLISTGENRYFKVFIYYYVSRSMLLTTIYFACNGLNIRTRNLLVKEATINEEKNKLEAELNVASEIQISSLPTKFIDDERIELSGDMHPAKEVGGDLFDYAVIDSNHIGFIIGDVSGKGVPAAMFMMRAISYFKAYIYTEKSPAKVLAKMNAELYNGNSNLMFLTAFLGIIDTDSGVVTYSNAGHNKPVVRNGVEPYRYLKCKHGFLLGTMDECYCSDETIALTQGGRIILYTDGVTEAQNRDGQLFGEEALINVLQGSHYRKNINIHTDILDHVKSFADGYDQSDDITLFSLTYKVKNIKKDSITVDSNLENLNTVVEFIESNLNKNNIDLILSNKINVVIDELYSNISNYGYKDTIGKIKVDFDYYDVDRKIVIRIIDNAPKFNPLETNDPDVSAKLEDRGIGGLGIFMVKKMTDSINYKYENNQNIVEFSIKI